MVKKVRTEKNLNLRDTLKYIKEHNLYKKKGADPPAATAPKTRKPRAKKEQGGSAQLPFVVERIEKGDVKATARKTGGVPSLNTLPATNRQICMVAVFRQQKLENQELKQFEILSSS